MKKSKFNLLYQQVMNSSKIIKQEISKNIFGYFKTNYAILRTAIRIGAYTQQYINNVINEICLNNIRYAKWAINTQIPVFLINFWENYDKLDDKSLAFKIIVTDIDQENLNISFKFSKQKPSDIYHNKTALKKGFWGYSISRMDPESDNVYVLPLIRFFLGQNIIKKWDNILNKTIQKKVNEIKQEEKRVAAQQQQEKQQFQKKNKQELQSLYQKYKEQISNIYVELRTKYNIDIDNELKQQYTLFNNQQAIIYLKSLSIDILKAFFYSLYKRAQQALRAYDTTYMDYRQDYQSKADDILYRIKCVKQQVKEIFGIII